MAGKFEHRFFAQIDLKDPFFDSLKEDYPEFETGWFPKGVAEGRDALVFLDEQGLGAFIAMKHEHEPIILQEGMLPARPRLKISTLLLAERFRGQRLGEGALGLILWTWQKSRLEEVYVTVFPQHEDLIVQLERFGFLNAGYNARGELLYIRSRKYIDYTDPYKAFPFISPAFNKGGYLIVEDGYHDTLFPYSELKNTLQEQLDKDVANGISKVYIGQQWQAHYQTGEPIFVYRKFSGATGKRYRSCLTSYCVVTDVIAVKRSGRQLLSFDNFCRLAGNKSVFTTEDLMNKYREDKNITVIQMLYCGYFGSGKNINMDWLDTNSLWNLNGDHPLTTQLVPSQCEMIWREGGVCIDDVLGR